MSAHPIRRIIPFVRYWWVNQNQTYETELKGNFLWSPRARTDGARNEFYENMRLLEPGDVVFSFNNTRIQALSVVVGRAQIGPKPNFGSAGLNWSQEGWFVPVFYCEFDRPIRPKDHIDVLRPFLPTKYSPLQANGNGLQSVYLAAVPDHLAHALIQLIGFDQYEEALSSVTGFPNTPDEELPDDSETLSTLGPTFRDQLIKARRGQGVFRANVLLVEESCRVTGVSDQKHLRASHIKPWKTATDTERLSGENGLLLSPHVDHLFDKGYVTFSSDEQLLVVPSVRSEVLEKWGIDAGVRVGQFNREQQAFLEYHRVNIFGRGTS